MYSNVRLNVGLCRGSRKRDFKPHQAVWNDEKRMLILSLSTIQLHLKGSIQFKFRYRIE